MKNVKKNQLGFTLIELLVTIALMLSILGIAVISFVNLSERKKEDSWELVQEQIETAAREYFTANEYLFESLSVGSSGTISVGKLVSDDYMNVVIDPTTGKNINKCSLVVVTKTNNGYKSEYSDYTGNDNCDSNNTIVISEPGAPELSVEVTDGKKGNDNWYTSNVKISAKASSNGNGKVIRTGLCNDEICLDYEENKYNNGDEYKDEYKEDFNIGNICYMAQNASGKKVYSCKSLGVDMTAPSISLTNVNSTWTNQTLWYNYSVSDNLGLQSVVGYWNKAGLTEADSNSTNYNWNNNSYGDGGNDTYKNKFTVGDTLVEGEDYFAEEGVRKMRYKACDQAGNCTLSDEKTVRIDTTPPVITVTSRNTNWTNASQITYDYTITDNLGISSARQYWNKSGLTEPQAVDDDYSWKNTSNFIGYEGGGNSEISLAVGTTKVTGSDTFEVEGYRKARVRACDQAGNCSGETATVKIDRTAPIVTIVSDNENWTDATYVNHHYTATDNLGLASAKLFWNKAGLSYDESETAKCSWTGNEYGTGNCIGTNSSNLISYAGQLSVTGTSNWEAEGARKVRIKACDQAGNCSSDYALAKIARGLKCSEFNNINTSNIGDYITVDVSPNYVDSITASSSGGTKVTFTYSSKDSKLKIAKDASAAWSSSKLTETTNHAGWNSDGSSTKVTKNTWCDTDYNCKSTYRYITTCISVQCSDDTTITKKICYRKDIKSESEGVFTKVE